MSSLATLIIHTVRARPQLFVSLPLRASSNCFSNFFKLSLSFPFFILHAITELELELEK